MASIEQVRKIDKKNGKNCMHWNVPPDALPGSATLVRVLDCWLNDWYVNKIEKGGRYAQL